MKNGAWKGNIKKKSQKRARHVNLHLLWWAQFWLCSFTLAASAKMYQYLFLPEVLKKIVYDIMTFSITS